MIFIYGQQVLAFWPVVPEPPQSTKNKIADEIFVNGVAVQITEFKSLLSMKQVLSFYRNKWSGKSSESESGEWKQISQFNNKYVTTVQVKENGFSGSTGRISVWEVPKKKPQSGKNIPIMNGSNILNEVISKDKYSVSTVVLISNTHSAEENMEFYEHYHKELGWKTIMKKNLQQSGISLVYKNDTDETTITINQVTGGSTIVMNKVVERSWFN